MTESRTLADVIQDAVAEYSAKTDKAMLNSFLFVAEFLEEDGCRSTQVSTPDGSITTHLGLAHYAVNLLSEIQRRDMLHLVYVDEDDDDE